MDLLATVAQLRDFLDDQSLDATRAEEFIRIAGAEVRGYTGQLFDFVEDDVIVLDGKGSSVLMLPELPVVNVHAVIEAVGRPAEVELAGPFATSPAFEWSEDGILRKLNGGLFANRYRWYQINYDHGYRTTPDDVNGIVLRCAARAFDNPEGIRQEALGRYSYTMAGEQAGIGLYAPDRRELDPYRFETRGRAGTAPAASGSGS